MTEQASSLLFFRPRFVGLLKMRVPYRAGEGATPARRRDAGEKPHVPSCGAPAMMRDRRSWWIGVIRVPRPPPRQSGGHHSSLCPAGRSPLAATLPKPVQRNGLRGVGIVQRQRLDRKSAVQKSLKGRRGRFRRVQSQKMTRE